MNPLEAHRNKRNKIQFSSYFLAQNNWPKSNNSSPPRPFVRFLWKLKQIFFWPKISFFHVHVFPKLCNFEHHCNLFEERFFIIFIIFILHCETPFMVISHLYKVQFFFSTKQQKCRLRYNTSMWPSCSLRFHCVVQIVYLCCTVQ